MAIKEQGIWGCTVLSGKAGEDPANGTLSVQINVQIDDGPSAGQRCTYDDQVNMKSAKYVGWSCSAVGWKGQSLKTLEADIAAWIAKTGGKSTVEIRHVEVKRGKAYDKWVESGCMGTAPIWDKVNGIGRGAAKTLRAPSAGSLADADEAMRSVMGDAPPDDDVPPASTGEDFGGYGGGTSPSDAANLDDIPFATCDITAEPSPIAKVLR